MGFYRKIRIVSGRHLFFVLYVTFTDRRDTDNPGDSPVLSWLQTLSLSLLHLNTPPTSDRLGDGRVTWESSFLTDKSLGHNPPLPIWGRRGWSNYNPVPWDFSRTRGEVCIHLTFLNHRPSTVDCRRTVDPLLRQEFSLRVEVQTIWEVSDLLVKETRQVSNRDKTDVTVPH